MTMTPILDDLLQCAERQHDVWVKHQVRPRYYRHLGITLSNTFAGHVKRGHGRATGCVHSY